METKKLSNKVLNFSGFGDFGFTLFVNVELYYWSAFLTDQAKFSLAMVAIITTTTSVIDCIWVPVTGWLIEKCDFKWGKFRSWFLIGPPIMILTYAMEFSRLSDNDVVAAAIVIVGFAIKTLAQDLAYSSSASLVSDLTNDPQERVTLASRRAILLSIGNVLFSLIGLPLITLCGNVVGDSVWGYTVAAIVFGVFNLICNMVPFKLTKGISVSGNGGREDGQVAEKKVEAEPKKKLTTAEMLQAVFKNPPLLFLMFGDAWRYLANFLMAAAGYYYFLVVLNNLPAMTLYLTVSRFAGLAGSTLAKPVVSKIGKRNCYLGGCAAMAILLVILFFVGKTVASFIAIQVVINFVMQISMATLTAMFTDCVVYYEYTTGKDARGFIMTMMCVPIKVGALIKGLALTAGLAAAGYVAGAETYSAETVKGIAALFCLYPAVCFALSVVIVGLGYKLTDKKVAEMSKAIEERKAAQN